ncbi:N-acetylmuramoyl-L-alanine amidase [Nocardia zapadnayensis]|nr:N-acetylmuramoyl-L-alanine amidase [Nocardia zapadnayensis]
MPTETPTSTPVEEPLTGFVVAVDPGHNGGNAAHPAEVTAPVPDGRGGTKACNTTGTASATDYPEHAFNWEVAAAVREHLEDLGAEVVLSREDDEGVGPCVDERGQFAGDAGADVLVSIHANGTEDTSAAGFHMIVAEDSPHAGVDEPSRTLAEDMVEAFGAADLAPNPAYGDDGIVARTDIAGLNHAEVPAVLVECGEMRNPDEAALMESAAGRERYAAAIVAGVQEFLED